MTNIMLTNNRKWLWLLLGFWLIVLQSVTLTHAVEHNLKHDHSHCIQCRIDNTSSAGPSTFNIGLLQAPQSEAINTTEYLQPSLPWFSQVNARAPPLNP